MENKLAEFGYRMKFPMKSGDLSRRWCSAYLKIMVADGGTEYVFVNESNPSLPFQYSMLKHRVYTLIHENDICKDNGERMGFATHLFRHCYGMKLVELHLDDAAIAHLLGHRGVNTVYRYRRASGKLLVKETEELRKTMDEILSEIIKEWDGYEQVFQNG